MKIAKFSSWVWYLNEGVTPDKNKNGKWMAFFNNDVDEINYISEACKEAVESEVVQFAKHTDLNGISGQESGVACFYLNGDDIEGHKRVISFLLKKNLIPKTKYGRYYNRSFKYDQQTRDGQYGNDFEGKIKLEQFINLETGEWLKK